MEKVTLIRDIMDDTYTVQLLESYDVLGFGLVSRVQLTYMTGKVEGAIMKPNIQKSIGKMMTKLIAGLIVKMEGKDATPSQKEALVKQMSIPDRDLLMQVHFICSFSEEAAFEGKCSCGEEIKAKHNLKDLEIKKPSKDSPKELSCKLHHGVTLGDTSSKDVVIIRADGVVQEQALVEGQSPVQVKDAILIRTIKSIVGMPSFPTRIITEEMSTKDKNIILAKSEEFEGSVNSYFTEQCPECGSDVRVSIPAGNYFAGE